MGCWLGKGGGGRRLGRPTVGGLVGQAERCDGSVGWSAKARAAMGGLIGQGKSGDG